MCLYLTYLIITIYNNRLLFENNLIAMFIVFYLKIVREVRNISESSDRHHQLMIIILYILQ